MDWCKPGVDVITYQQWNNVLIGSSPFKFEIIYYFHTNPALFGSSHSCVMISTKKI
jgi:hypothetical protein